METAEEIAQRTADGHAFTMHVQRTREFENSSYGTPVPISTREEFKEHILRVLESTETLCCTVFTELFPDQPVDIFYHPATNTMVVVPENPLAEPTAYRPNYGIGFFNQKAEVSADLGYDVEIRNSIYELRPELAAAKEAKRIELADQTLREALEQRFEKEKSDLLSRHAQEIKHSSNRESDESRHAEELQGLSERKEDDFQRLRRERENSLRLQKENRQRELEQQRLHEGKEFGPGRKH